MDEIKLIKAIVDYIAVEVEESDDSADDVLGYLTVEVERELRDRGIEE